MKIVYQLEHGIIFDSIRSELIVNEEVILLQELENTLLTLFVNRPGDIISKDELFAIGWEGRFGSDNSLNRVISTLRTKLGDNSKSPSYIKTVPKKGYRFIADVKQVEQKNPPSETSPTSPVHEETADTPSTFRWYIPLSVVLVIAATLSIIFSFDNTPAPQIKNLVPITSMPGSEMDPDISPDGRHIVFTNKADLHEKSKIYIKSIHSEQKTVITDSQYNSQSPKWSYDGRSILYHRTAKDFCQIRRIDLNLQLDVISDVLLTECGKFSDSIGLSWGKDENEFYYTDIDRPLVPYHIFRFDIKNGTREKIAEPEVSSGRGYYRVQYDRDSGNLIALLNERWVNTNVVLFNAEQKIIKKRYVKYLLMGATLLDGGVVFKTEGNHIHYSSPESSKEHRLIQSPLKPVYSPTFRNGPRPLMAFVAGDFINRDLIAINLETGQEEVISQGDYVHKQPYATESGSIYYASDKSGLYQIWKYQDNTSVPVSAYMESHIINSISVSADETYLAAGYDNTIDIFDISTNSISRQPRHQLKHVQYPRFSPDGKQIILTRIIEDGFQLSIYDLEKEEYTDVAINNGYIGFIHPETSDIYFTRMERSGLWLFKDGEEILVNEDIKIRSQNNYHVAGNHLYFLSEKGQLTQLNLSTRQVKKFDVNIQPMFTLDTRTNSVITTKSRQGDTNIYLATF